MGVKDVKEDLNRHVRGKRGRSTKAQGGGKSPRKATNAFTYRPNRAEKEAIKELAKDQEKVVTTLTQLVESGHSVKLSWTDRTNSCVCTLSEGGVEWTEAATVFVFHVEAWVALAAAAYYLLEVNPMFPDNTLVTEDFAW